jgi:hypothetical protein
VYACGHVSAGKAWEGFSEAMRPYGRKRERHRRGSVIGKVSVANMPSSTGVANIPCSTVWCLRALSAASSLRPSSLSRPREISIRLRSCPRCCRSQLAFSLSPPPPSLPFSLFLPLSPSSPSLFLPLWGSQSGRGRWEMIVGASVRPAVTTPQVPLAPCKRAANPSRRLAALHTPYSPLQCGVGTENNSIQNVFSTGFGALGRGTRWRRWEGGQTPDGYKALAQGICSRRVFDLLPSPLCRTCACGLSGKRGMV